MLAKEVFSTCKEFYFGTQVINDPCSAYVYLFCCKAIINNVYFCGLFIISLLFTAEPFLPKNKKRYIVRNLAFSHNIWTKINWFFLKKIASASKRAR
jgi:hypothetical protein